MFTTCLQVGGEVARRARGLGMNVIAYDPYASEEKARAVGVTLVSLDEALAQGDFFSLHMPLTPGKKGREDRHNTSSCTFVIRIGHHGMCDWGL